MTVTWGAIKDAVLDPVGAIRWWWREWRWTSPECADCGVELMPRTPFGSRDWQRYMVHDHVWAAAGIGYLDGWLCIPCLEGRLGRPLTGADLEAVPLNDPDVDDDTDRLAELKHAAAQRNSQAGRKRRRT